ncbi:hypothetical protein PR048_025788 [Dryococelus australis]|uniref:WH2 domain-containing protein n=1 Tax=Dryococelus australis TaxID=614101 RepID=A0ABQ9GJH8_9NEOP|nr:hypothetical protein PR048_025788 [Dryococelus australis]
MCLMLAGYPGGMMRNTLLRRGSMQGQKPPPPVRRTSSISSGTVVSLRQHQASPPGLDNLPPPPAFLLDSTAAGVPSSGVSVADTVRTLTELKHTPASPGVLRRNGGVRSASAERRGGEAAPGLMVALSAKLSPRNCRRHSEDLNPAGSRIVAPAQGFLHALNVKLALQQQQNNRAARVRHWVASRTQPDPVLCHESLMDQIRRGTTLRRTSTSNDRSAPKIR